VIVYMPERGYSLLSSSPTNFPDIRVAIATAAVTAGQIVIVDGSADGAVPKVSPADSDALGTSNGLLFVALTGQATVGGYLKIVPEMRLTAQNTSGLAVGQRVYLSGTAGGWSATVGFIGVAVGVVEVVSATVGVIYLSPGSVVAVGSATAMVSAGATVANTITETSTYAMSLPASTLAAGTRVRIRWAIQATATNSTDTLLAKLYLGATALSTTANPDVANNDGAQGEYEFTVRAAPSAASAIVGAGWSVGPAATGAGTFKPEFIPATNFATNGALTIALKLTWSVANAGNIAAGTMFNVDVIPA
jgi:hypothetical protein